MRPRHQDGQVEVRGNGKLKYYAGRYSVYVKDQNGKDVRKQPRPFLGYCNHMTKTEALDKLRDLIFKENKTEVRATDKVNLTWFFDNRFRPMRESRWEAPTKKCMLYDWENYIKPELGAKPLADFDKFVLQTHFNQMAQRNFSKWLIKRTKTLLSSIFIEAVDLKFMGSSPMMRVKLPKCKLAHKPVLEFSELWRLYSALEYSRDRLILLMAVAWGPRSSEIFGLTVEAWKGDCFEILNTAWEGKLRPTTVKTANSRRKVPIPDELREGIERWVREQGLSGSDVLFAGRDGKSPLWGNTWLQKRVQRVAKQLGIETPVTFQVLRRSFDTRHRNELKDAAAVAGHSEETARKLYAQSVPAAARRMVQEDVRRFFAQASSLITEKVQ